MSLSPIVSSFLKKEKNEESAGEKMHQTWGKEIEDFFPPRRFLSPTKISFPHEDFFPPRRFLSPRLLLGGGNLKKEEKMGDREFFEKEKYSEIIGAGERELEERPLHYFRGKKKMKERRAKKYNYASLFA